MEATALITSADDARTCLSRLASALPSPPPKGHRRGQELEEEEERKVHVDGSVERHHPDEAHPHQGHANQGQGLGLPSAAKQYNHPAPHNNSLSL